MFAAFYVPPRPPFDTFVLLISVFILKCKLDSLQHPSAVQLKCRNTKILIYIYILIYLDQLCGTCLWKVVRLTGRKKKRFIKKFKVFLAENVLVFFVVITFRLVFMFVLKKRRRVGTKTQHSYTGGTWHSITPCYRPGLKLLKMLWRLYRESVLLIYCGWSWSLTVIEWRTCTKNFTYLCRFMTWLLDFHHACRAQKDKPSCTCFICKNNNNKNKKIRVL